MFIVPKVNVVASDEGFSVEVLGRTGIEYREGDRSLFVDSEVLEPGHGIAVYKNSLKTWRSPHEKEQIDTAERQRIIENIRRAMAFRGHEIEVL